MSHAQQRLWVLDQLDRSQRATYNISGGFTVTGDLNVGALRQALHSLVETHEILRTFFTEVRIATV